MSSSASHRVGHQASVEALVSRDHAGVLVPGVQPVGVCMKVRKSACLRIFAPLGNEEGRRLVAFPASASLPVPSLGSASANVAGAQVGQGLFDHAVSSETIAPLPAQMPVRSGKGPSTWNPG